MKFDHFEWIIWTVDGDSEINSIYYFCHQKDFEHYYLNQVLLEENIEYQFKKNWNNYEKKDTLYLSFLFLIFASIPSLKLKTTTNQHHHLPFWSPQVAVVQDSSKGIIQKNLGLGSKPYFKVQAANVQVNTDESLNTLLTYKKKRLKPQVHILGNFLFNMQKNNLSSYTFQSWIKENKFLMGRAKKYFTSTEDKEVFNRVEALFINGYQDFYNNKKKQNQEPFEEQFKPKDLTILAEGCKEVSKSADWSNVTGKERKEQINKESSIFLDSDAANSYDFIKQGKIGKKVKITNNDKIRFNEIINNKDKNIPISLEDQVIVFLELVEHHIVPQGFGISAPNKKKVKNQLHLDIPPEIIQSDANKQIEFKLPNNVMEDYAKSEFGLRSRGNNLKPNANFGSKMLSIIMQTVKEKRMVTPYPIGPLNTEMLTFNVFTQAQLEKNQQDCAVQGWIDNITATEIKILYIKQNNDSLSQDFKRAQYEELWEMIKQKSDLIKASKEISWMEELINDSYTRFYFLAVDGSELYIFLEE